MVAGEDAACAGDVAFGGGADEVGVAVGPAGEVGEAVVVADDAELVADEVGDAFGFDLHAGTVVAGAVGVVVEQDVAEFVGKGLDGLAVVDVVADANGAGGVVGVAVGAVTVSALGGVQPQAIRMRRVYFSQRAAAAVQKVSSTWLLSGPPSSTCVNKIAMLASVGTAYAEVPVPPTHP